MRSRSLFDVIKALGKLYRLLPVMTMTGSIFLINFAWAWRHLGRDILPNGVIFLLGASVLNGIFTHAINDLEDWHSGTDKVSTGILSGGSRVLKNGSFSEEELKTVALASFVFCVLVGLYFFFIRGPLILLFLALGLLIAWAYTSPPIRLAYTPFVGELIGLWISGQLLSLASYFIFTGRFDLIPFFAGIVHTTLIVGWLMQHHIPDIPADIVAIPKKITTPAFFYLKWGPSSASIPSLVYFTIAAFLSILGANFIHPIYKIMFPSCLAGILAAIKTKANDINDVTKKQVFTTGVILVNSIIFALYVVK